MFSVSVIIAAGGAGRRFAAASGVSVPGAIPRGPTPSSAAAAPLLRRTGKAFISLAGRPVLAHTLDRFDEVESVLEAVVAVPADALALARQTFSDHLPSGRPLRFVAGGPNRTESVARALAVSDPKADLVAIHDAVRPLIRPAVIRAAMEAAADHGAAVVGRPVDHTVKEVALSRCVVRTVPRDGLWIAQTPQVFRREVIVRAYAVRGATAGRVTDDAQWVEAMGLPVVMVEGDAANIKITIPEDLRLCEALLAAGWPFEPPTAPS